jgi:hypothetical protein
MPLPDAACKLNLRHLNKAHIDLLCAYEGIVTESADADSAQLLEQHLAARLEHDCVLTPLAGAHLVTVG